MFALNLPVAHNYGMAPRKPLRKAKPKPVKKHDRPGRPNEFRQEYIDQAASMALSGATDDQIADGLGVSIRSLYRYSAQFEKFRQAIKYGKDHADDRVERSLYHRAVGYEHDAVKVAFNKDGKPLYAPYRERVEPDTTAQIFWLKNRRPKEWRDKIEQEITGDAKFLPIAYIQALNIALGYDPNAKPKTEKIAETVTEKTVDISAILPD